MSVDEALLESATAKGGISLRFYRWGQPTLSLGYFQQYNDRWQHAASRSCAAVRRATGGGAILHDRELTYSFIAPPGHRLAARHIELYISIHTILVDVLANHGISAKLCQPEGRERDRTQPFLCFQRRSPADVLVADVKIAGSAQRRSRSAVLQHGSVILASSPAAPELAGLEEVTGTSISFDQLAQGWLSRLTELLSMEWQPGLLTDWEKNRAEELVREKYDSTEWTHYRGHGANEKKQT